MKCKVCKRPLSDPKSIDRGMGNICAGHSLSELGSDIAKRVSFDDVYSDELIFGEAFVMKRAGKPGDADHARHAITNVPHLVVHHSPSGFEFGYAEELKPGLEKLGLVIPKDYMQEAEKYQAELEKALKELE